MYSCDPSSDLLLDYLYGLLDEGEAQGLRAHLASCPACRAALAAAEAQQNLIARAAQVYATVPAFTAPAAELAETSAAASAPAEPPAPATLPLPSRSRRRWARLSVAAALLLTALAVYGVVAHRNGLAGRQAEATRTQKEVEAVDARLALAETVYQQERAALPVRLRGDYVQVRMTGPAHYGPAAASRYHLAARGLDGVPARAALTVRLIDPLRKAGPLFEQDVEVVGDATLTLPAGLPVRSESLAGLEVEARHGAVRDKLPAAAITVLGPSYLTHLATSKPAYRTGETLYFRALALERFSLKPPAQDLRLAFVLRGPNGQAVQRFEAPVRHGVAAGAFALAPSLGEGGYTLEVVEASPAAGKAPRVLPDARRLRVVRGESPRLHFDRPQYAQGQRGLAVFRGPLGQNGAPAANQAVIVEADLNGKPVRLPGSPPGRPELQLRTDRDGVAAIPFQVPAGVLTTGSATMRMKVQIHDGRTNAKVIEQVPVVAQSAATSAVHVDFFPEGGDLVAGLPARVYFQARDALGEPVAIAGVVVDRQDRQVVRVRAAGSLGEPSPQIGAGVCTFTPAAGEAYTLKLTSAKGTGQAVALPPVQPAGVVLHAPEGVSREGEPLRVAVRDTQSGRSLFVVASCRGRMVDQQAVTAGPDGTTVALHPIAGTRGVVRVTVGALRDGVFVPLAERLVYRAPAEYLALSVAGLDAKAPLRFPPGASVDLGADVKTESGKPAAGWLTAAVVNQNALPHSGPKAEASPAAAFYLTRAVRHPEELEDADFLLADSAPARQALDLFLGIHGWRHFVPAERLAAARLDPKQARAQVSAGMPAILVIETRLEELKGRYFTALSAREKGLHERVERAWADLRVERERRLETARLAAQAVGRYEALPREYVRTGVIVTLLLLFAAGGLFLLLGLVRLLRRAGAAAPSFALACGALALCVATYLLTGGLRTADAPSGNGGTLARLARKEWLPPEGPRQPALREQADPQNAGPDRAGRLYVLGTKKASEERAAAAGGFSEGAAKGQAGGRGGEKTRTMAGAGPNLFRDVAQARREQLKADALDRGFGSGKTPHMARPIAPPGMGMGGKGGAPAAPSQGGLRAGRGDQKGDGQAKKAEANEVRRQYVHRNAAGESVYQDTIFWQPALEAADGKAALRFDLPDTAATYRVLIYGHDAAGRLGVFQGKLEAAR